MALSFVLCTIDGTVLVQSICEDSRNTSLLTVKALFNTCRILASVGSLVNPYGHDVSASTPVAPTTASRRHEYELCLDPYVYYCVSTAVCDECCILVLFAHQDDYLHCTKVLKVIAFHIETIIATIFADFFRLLLLHLRVKNEQAVEDANYDELLETDDNDRLSVHEVAHDEYFRRLFSNNNICYEQSQISLDVVVAALVSFEMFFIRPVIDISAIVRTIPLLDPVGQLDLRNTDNGAGRTIEYGECKTHLITTKPSQISFHPSLQWISPIIVSLDSLPFGMTMCGVRCHLLRCQKKHLEIVETAIDNTISQVFGYNCSLIHESGTPQNRNPFQVLRTEWLELLGLYLQHTISEHPTSSALRSVGKAATAPTSTAAKILSTNEAQALLAQQTTRVIFVNDPLWEEAKTHCIVAALCTAKRNVMLAMLLPREVILPSVLASTHHTKEWTRSMSSTSMGTGGGIAVFPIDVLPIAIAEGWQASLFRLCKGFPAKLELEEGFEIYSTFQPQLLVPESTGQCTEITADLPKTISHTSPLKIEDVSDEDRLPPLLEHSSQTQLHQSNRPFSDDANLNSDLPPLVTELENVEEACRPSSRIVDIALRMGSPDTFNELLSTIGGATTTNPIEGGMTPVPPQAPRKATRPTRNLTSTAGVAVADIERVKAAKE